MLNRKTIVWAYWNGEINMRKSAGVWMVDVPSLWVRYGKPVHKPDVGQD